MENDAFDTLALLAENVKSYRKARRITQRELATIAGLSPATIGAIETANENMRLRTMEKLCRAIDISPARILAPTVIDDMSGKRIPVEEVSSEEAIFTIRSLLDRIEEGGKTNN